MEVAAPVLLRLTYLGYGYIPGDIRAQEEDPVWTPLARATCCTRQDTYENKERTCIYCQTPDLGQGLEFDFTFAMEQQ